MRGDQTEHLDEAMRGEGGKENDKSEHPTTPETTAVALATKIPSSTTNPQGRPSHNGD